MSEEGYFDNNATTKPFRAVIRKIASILQHEYGNPSSSYALGCSSRERMENERQSIAKCLGIRDGKQLIFTSCASESNNMILRGRVSRYACSFIPHIIITSIEHPSVYETCRNMSRRGLCTYSMISTDNYGYIKKNELRSQLSKFRKRLVLVAIILGNNEIGSIQDGKEIYKLCKNAHAPHMHLHMDATQMIGKYRINFESSNYDSIAFAAHKFHGPKGIGGLYLRNNKSIDSCITGGGQETNLRAGTENLAYIAGMAEALRICTRNMRKRRDYIIKLRNYLEDLLLKIPNTKIHVPLRDPKHRLYNTISVSFDGVSGNELMRVLDKNNLYVNVGSACSKGKTSRILNHIGLSPLRQKSTLRISLSCMNRKKDCTRLFRSICSVLDYNIDLRN